MGYRTLLRRYIQHVELATGDNFIESRVLESELSARDVGELQTLAAEIRRGERLAPPAAARNPNQRLRLLMSRYGLDSEQLARISGIEAKAIRSWRASPRSALYREMEENDLSGLEQTLTRWLENS